MVSTPTGRRAPGTLESAIMGLLWSRAEPLTAGDVQSAIGGDLAYNTVQTILTRLLEKNLVQRRKAGRGHVYWPVEDSATAAATRMRAALSDRLDRHAVLQQFAASLDEDDAATLHRLLTDIRRSDRS
jgi:predicted transcriptional regulator